MAIEDPVKIGDPLQIQADTWNALMEMLRYFRGSRGRLGLTGNLTSLTRSNLNILVCNAVGDDLFGMFRVVRLGDPLNDISIDPMSTIRKICLNGFEPNDPTNAFAILQQPLDEGRIGKGVIQGMTLAFVMLTDVSHQYANPTPYNTTWLTSSDSGLARILWTGDIDSAISQGLLNSWSDIDDSGESGDSGESADDSGYSFDSGSALASDLKLALILMPGITAESDSGSGGTGSGGSGASVPDATHTVSGIVNLVDQYLGAGTKSFDTIKLPITDGTLSGNDLTIDAMDLSPPSAIYGMILNPVSSLGSPTVSNGKLEVLELFINAGSESLWGQVGGYGFFPGPLSLYWRNVPLTGVTAGPSTSKTAMMLTIGPGTTPLTNIDSAVDATSASLVVGGYITAVGAHAQFNCGGNAGLTGTLGPGAMATGGIVTNLGSGSYGSGTVTTVSVASAHGFAGTVATATTTPVITLSTTVTGLLKGDGTSISAAVAGTDYVTPSGVAGAYQPLDATLTALAAANWAANAIPIGSGADTLSQISFAANTFPARGSTGNLVAKTITDFILTLVDDTDAATARTTLGLVIGTNVAAFSHTHAAADIVSGVIDTARLGSGTANNTTFLRGDQTWAVPTLALDITGLTKDTSAWAYELPMYRTQATVGNKKTTIGEMFATPQLIPGGRLTLDSSDPIAESTGANTLYYLPYTFNGVPLWDGTRWVFVNIGSHAVTGATLSGLTSGKPYDVFGYLSSGALASEILVWTNDTTRATTLTRSNSLWYKTGDQTRLYLGTFYSTSTTQTKDTPQARYLWNAYNRVPYCDWSFDSTDSWTNSGNGTWSAMNSGNAAWIHSHVIGMLSEPITAEGILTGFGSGFGMISYDGSVTLDRAVTSIGSINTSGGVVGPPAPMIYCKRPAEGKHSVNAMQTSLSASSYTAIGDNSSTGSVGGGVYGQNNGMRVRGYR